MKLKRLLIVINTKYKINLFWHIHDISQIVNIKKTDWLGQFLAYGNGKAGPLTFQARDHMALTHIWQPLFTSIQHTHTASPQCK